jgi:hypothetical protein
VNGYCPCRAANVCCAICMEREEVRTTAGAWFALRDAWLDLVNDVRLVLLLELDRWTRRFRRTP